MPQIGVTRRVKKDFGDCPFEAMDATLPFKGTGQVALVIKINQQSSKSQLMGIATKLADQRGFTNAALIDADE